MCRKYNTADPLAQHFLHKILFLNISSEFNDNQALKFLRQSKENQTVLI